MAEFLTGERIVLRSLELEDLDLFWSWFADREVVRYSLGMWQFPWSRSETQQWLEKTLRDKETLSLGIVEKASGRLIGYAGIAAIGRINRSGEYYLFLGEKDSWGKGYGTEATRLIVHHGFSSLNLQRIGLSVYAVNTGGVKAYTRAGFKQEGVLRQAGYRDGNYHDVLVMSIIRPEWEAAYR